MEGCCTFCNATGLQLLRYDRAIELQGCNMHEAILHSNAEEQLIPRRDAELFNCLQEGRPVHSDSDVFWRADNTSFPVEFRSHPVTQDGRLKGAVVTFTDISARQQADKAQELLELQFHQSQKLESLGLLAGGIAHDFNNLLVGILGNTTLIQQDLPEGSPHASQLAIIAKSAERASELTTQLMNYSGRRHLRAQSVDLVDLVEEMSHLLNSSISKSAELNLDLAKDMTRVAGDATQLRQVIMNLITNASDALEDQRGTIRIRVAMSTPPPPTLNGLILGTPPDASPSCLVEVCDSGVGMTSETQKRIFDPFFTTRSKGRGLGLSAVLGIISGHGGSIHLKSELEKGTCISICLPPSTLPEEPVSRVTQSSATQRPTLEAVTVMVVDDEPLVREVVIKILTRAGHQVITASTGEESVQKFEENGDRIDIVMMDLTMPGISGIQAAHEIRLLDPNIPIVISSGHTKERSNIDIPKLAPLEFLGKPFKANALLNALSRVIELHGSKRE
jgi:signal transduction histidine kinase/ActR/RegA family two-component response regulator